MSFLDAHSSIRSLHVFDSDVSPHDDRAKRILPNLHTISANPLFLSGMAHKCDGLKYIKCLTFDLHGVQHVVHEVDMAISAVDGFPNVKHCSVNRIISGSATAQIMQLLGPSSVELEHWTGGFSYRNYRELGMIREAASAFPALRRMDIGEWTFSTKSVPKYQLKALASGFPHLMKICLYTPHVISNEIVSVFKIAPRIGISGSVNLTKTYQLKEGGPYKQDRRAIDFNSVIWEDELVLEEEIFS